MAKSIKSQTMLTKQFWDNGHYGIRSAEGFDDNGYINGNHMAKSEEIISHIEKIVDEVLYCLGNNGTFKDKYKDRTKWEKRILRVKIKAINKDRKGTKKEIMDKVRNLFKL